MMMKRNSGFSLVELMVAMLIGLIIVLGAGQLFLTVFQTNRQVEALSEKQAAVNFAVETLLRDIRRASDVTVSSSSLTVKVPNRGDVANCDGVVEKVYTLDANDLKLEQGCGSASGGAEAIASAFAPNGFDVQPGASDGVWIISFSLLSAGGGPTDSLAFHAVNRTAAVGGASGG